MEKNIGRIWIWWRRDFSQYAWIGLGGEHQSFISLVFNRLWLTFLLEYILYLQHLVLFILRNTKCSSRFLTMRIFSA